MKYVKLGNFDNIIVFESPTYGNYNVRKIAEVDLMLALKNKELHQGIDEFNKLKSKYSTYRTKKLNTIKVDEIHSFSRFDFYIPFFEDNKDWVDPRGLSKILPVGSSLNKFNI